MMLLYYLILVRLYQIIMVETINYLEKAEKHQEKEVNDEEFN